MKTYFTSDTHFNHAAVIGFCRPQFKTLDEMNRTIIDNWNARVRPEDTVYHLGDVAFGDNTQHGGFVKSLNGTKVLIRGNHDRKVERMISDGFDEVYNSLFAKIDGKTVFMRHIPPLVHDPSGRTYKHEFLKGCNDPYDYWLCGHVHEKWKRIENIINVGVDQWSFTPRTLDELIA